MDRAESNREVLNFIGTAGLTVQCLRAQKRGFSPGSPGSRKAS